MKASKPISTVSYLTPTNLRIALDALKERGDILHYAFINHQPEKVGRKEHRHCIIVPTSTIDTSAKYFELLFTEYVVGEELPRKCEPWQRSKNEDFFGYALHDVNYLAQKGLSRLFHYKPTDFVTDDKEWLEDEIEKALANTASCIDKIMQCVTEGLNVVQAMSRCRVPYGSMASFIKAYDLCKLLTSETNETYYEFNQTTGEVKTYKLINGKKEYINA